MDDKSTGKMSGMMTCMYALGNYISCNGRIGGKSKQEYECRECETYIKYLKNEEEMKKLEIKEGDTVRVKSGLKAGKKYGYLTCSDEMTRMAGKLLTVFKIARDTNLPYMPVGSYLASKNPQNYLLVMENEYAWAEDMVEKAVESVKPKRKYTKRVVSTQGVMPFVKDQLKEKIVPKFKTQPSPMNDDPHEIIPASRLGTLKKEGAETSMLQGVIKALREEKEQLETKICDLKWEMFAIEQKIKKAVKGEPVEVTNFLESGKRYLITQKERSTTQLVSSVLRLKVLKITGNCYYIDWNNYTKPTIIIKDDFHEVYRVIEEEAQDEPKSSPNPGDNL